MIEVPGWVILNFFTSFLLILLLIFQNKTSRLQKGKKYSAILICTLVLLISETVGRVGENNPENLLLLARIGYFIIFILDPVDILFAVSYVDCWMDKENSEPRMCFKTAFQSFAIINAVLVTMSSVLQLRWFFYFENNTFVLLHHFRKKTQKTPRREIIRAIEEMNDWRNRKDSRNSLCISGGI